MTNPFHIIPVMENNIHLLIKLKEFIERRGITQVEIAEALGVTKGLVSNWLNYRADKMSSDNARLVSMVLATPDDLSPKHYLILMALYEEFRIKGDNQ